MNLAELLVEGVFKIQTFEQAECLADHLSAISPNLTIVRMGLLELFTNAIEHGNLKITSDEKSQLQKDGIWIDEINRRLDLSEHQHKFVKVEVKRQDKELKVIVTDQGEGFDWNKFQEEHEKCSKKVHGRGIMMAKKLAFKDLQYLGKGNVAVGIISLAK